MNVPIGYSCSTGQPKSSTWHQIWEHLGLLNLPMWLRPKTSKISYSVQVCFNSVTVSIHFETRLLKYKAAFANDSWKKNLKYSWKSKSVVWSILRPSEKYSFLTCSLASIKSAGKNTVPLQRPKVNPSFFPFTSRKTEYQQ